METLVENTSSASQIPRTCYSTVVKRLADRQLHKAQRSAERPELPESSSNDNKFTGCAMYQHTHAVRFNSRL